MSTKPTPVLLFALVPDDRGVESLSLAVDYDVFILLAILGHE